MYILTLNIYGVAVAVQFSLLIDYIVVVFYNEPRTFKQVVETSIVMYSTWQIMALSVFSSIPFVSMLFRFPSPKV